MFKHDDPAPPGQYSKDTTKLVFATADMLGCDLHFFQGHCRGMVQKKLALSGVGPALFLPVDFTVIMDEVGDKLVTSFCRFRKNLWMYTIVSPKYSGLLFFDGDRAKIRVGGEREFGLGSAAVTILKIKESVVAAYQLTPDKHWEGSSIEALGL